MSDVAVVSEHGGSGLDFLQSHFPHAPRPWLDLSTGICPWAYPHPAISQLALASLPSPSLLNGCRTGAAGYFNIPKENLAVLPGSQAAISLLPRLFSPRRVSVLEPTYNEHAQAWRLSGHEVVPIQHPEGDIADILVLTNPNNPDGRLFRRDELLALVTERSRQDRWTIVDEAFIDLVPSESIANACARNKLVVLRSFGKFFGLAGLRLGFAIAKQGIARQLEDAIGPWAVSGAALEIGARAYRDNDWQSSNRHRLHRAILQQREILSRAGLCDMGGTDLFILSEHPNAAGLFRRLCELGIYVRKFQSRPDQLRFGLVPDETSHQRLEDALNLWVLHR
ncbi:MAG TPA: threonine-phosphate decarboxylase CobD [Rhizomicrobium sp.]|jgi:cobalamin biosynthetic protein CobC